MYFFALDIGVFRFVKESDGSKCSVSFYNAINGNFSKKGVRRRLRQMIHTTLSATHMVDISLRDPGGGEMIKVRLQGTKEDMEWLEKQLSECPEVKITESSETFGNKGTSKYYRKYLEINRKNEE